MASPILIFIYVAAIVAANLSVAYFGPQVTPINAFLFIGLDLAVRNFLAITLSPLKMLALIAGAGTVSYLLNPASGQIAIASLCAFTLAALADWGTYRFSAGRWIKRCLMGVSVGAVVDSLVFPTIAFGALMPGIVAAQIVAKIAGGTLWALLIQHYAKPPQLLAPK